MARIVPSQVSPGTADGVTVFPLSSSNTAYKPVDLVTGPDHELWVSDSLGGVWQVNPADPAPAANHFFQITGNSPEPEGITSSGGRLWVALIGAGQVAEINPATAVSPITTVFATGGSPLWIAGAGDGNLWLTDQTNSHLIEFNPTTDAAASFGSSAGVTGDANADAADGSGNLWFTEFHAGRIGEVAFVLVNISPPTLSGDAKPGSALGCSTGQWSPQADAFSYQWLRDGATISGATAASYTLPADAAGHAFACQVTATETATFTSGTATSAPVTATAAGATPKPAPTPTSPPATLRNVSPPTITGTAKEGGKLTCHPGTWTVKNASFRYQWFWNGSDGGRIRKLNPGIKSIGTKPSKLNRLLNTPVARLRQILFASGQTVTVPTIAAPTQFSCAAIASAPEQLPVTAHSTTLAVNPGPPQLLRNLRTLKLIAPHVNPKVGVSGTNTCSSGAWTGGPKFRFVWYLIARERNAPTGTRFKVGSGARYVVTSNDEQRTLACSVVTNRWGSATARSNSYLVPLGAPRQTSATEVVARTPSGSTTLDGIRVGDRRAGHAHLRSRPMEPADLSFAYTWTVPADGDPSDTESGQKLDFDMRPGHLQYDDLGVQCQVTATTSHGVSSTAQSGTVFVSNGCTEETTYLNLNNMPISPFETDYGSYDWLQAVGPDAHGDVEGFFGYWGNNLIAGGQPHRAETFGPDCGDYGLYLHNAGFDVRQYDPSNPQWIFG